MKTKIIYISGNEVFEMAQIRAAFEEVRSALGLDNDTILFGVPVDADNALADTVSETKTEQAATPIVETVEVCEEIVEPAPEITPIIDEVKEEEPIEIADVQIQEPEQEIEPESAQTEDVEPESEPVIPILSILSINEEQVVEQSDEPVAIVAETAPQPIEEEQPEIDVADTLTVSIDDIVADEAPVMERKKTLEELLESMEPLGEDEIPVIEDAKDSEPDAIVEEQADFSVSMTDDMSDTDATLAQLANEFAQTQDKIPEAPKTSGNGKIGKLKNILPFKKAKRDDSSLMGDLFGWAGIAANDEDFSIPGFFTSAAGQK